MSIYGKTNGYSIEGCQEDFEPFERNHIPRDCFQEVRHSQSHFFFFLIQTRVMMLMIVDQLLVFIFFLVITWFLGGPRSNTWFQDPLLKLSLGV